MQIQYKVLGFRINLCLYVLLMLISQYKQGSEGSEWRIQRIDLSVGCNFVSADIESQSTGYRGDILLRTSLFIYVLCKGCLFLVYIF